MTTTFHALWMLCALGAVVHAATAAHRVRDVTALAVGFVLATIVASPQRLPDPVWVGALSAGVAIAVLFRPRFAVLAAGWGGALGGMLTALTEVQGVPRPPRSFRSSCSSRQWYGSHDCIHPLRPNRYAMKRSSRSRCSASSCPSCPA